MLSQSRPAGDKAALSARMRALREISSLRALAEWDPLPIRCAGHGEATMTEGWVLVILLFLLAFLLVVGIICNASNSRDEERRRGGHLRGP